MSSPNLGISDNFAERIMQDIIVCGGLSPEKNLDLRGESRNEMLTSCQMLSNMHSAPFDHDWEIDGHNLFCFYPYSQATMEAILKANESMIEATSKVKKQKVQQASLSHMECVAMRLWDVQKDLRKNYDDAGLSAIEVEVDVHNIQL